MNNLNKLRKSITRKNRENALSYEQTIENLIRPAFQKCTRQFRENEDPSFEEYIKRRPAQPNESRKYFYIQKLGQFSPAQLQAIEQLIEYIETLYGLEVRVIEDIQESMLINDAIVQKKDGVYLESEYILHHLIADFVPKMAMALICITSYPLFSNDDGGHIMGHALLKYRAALWTMHPFDFEGNKDQSSRDLESLLKLAAHEIGHVFSLRHCEQYECMMGIVDYYYLESYPATYCPTCLAKLFWNLDIDEFDWLQKQYQYWLKIGHSKNSQLYKRLMDLWHETV